MRRIELGMSLEYVSNWTIVDAIREIFQNSLDEEIENPENKWYFNYDKENQILRVGNKLSKLSTKSLLLGQSSKRDNFNTIGQHGEGYKVATIVLLREGCGVKVYNYNEKEIWTAKVIKSKRYGADIGVFDIEKVSRFKEVPEHSLIFEVTNISQEVYEQIKDKNLWLQEDLGEVIEAEGCGKVLLDEKYKGRIYVKGLYVCSKSYVEYGYDFEPKMINLDRDRGLVDSLNLQFQIGKLMANTKNAEFLKEARKTWDGSYTRIYTTCDSVYSEVYSDAYNQFRGKYGLDAYPCTDTEKFNKLKNRGVNVAMVTDNEYHYITNAPGYEPPAAEEIPNFLSTELKSWFQEIQGYLPEQLKDKGEDLIERVVSELY